MKKIAIATILASSFLALTSHAGISGKIGEYVDNVKVGSATTTSLVTEPTSNFAITAGEKLGGGMTARATVETSLSGNTIGGTGTQLGDRQATVGLQSKLGSVDLGRNVHSQFLAITNNDAFSTLYGSIAGDVHNLRGLRMSNAVFATANVAGATVSYDRSQDLGNATSYSVAGSVAGIKATAATYSVGTQKSTVYGLNTKLAGLNVFYTHSEDKNGAVKSTGNLVGVTRGFGPVTAKASYGTTADKTAYSVGLDYALSKRTEVGVAYRSVDNKKSTADVAQLGLGLVHRF